MAAYPTRAALAVLVGLGAGACDAADNTVDPGDLALRDLLGFAPEVALEWDAAQRGAARAVIARGLERDGVAVADHLGLGVGLDERVAFALAAIDEQLAAAEVGALGLLHVRIADAGLEGNPVPVGLAEPAAAPPIDLWLSPAWDRHPGGRGLPLRGLDVLNALATRAGHADGPLVVVPAPRLAVVAAYVEAVPDGSHAGADGRPHLLVNPILLAALEPLAGDPGSHVGAAATAGAASGKGPAPRPALRPFGGGVDRAPAPGAAAANPYSFYGSIAECAYAEQLRCEACLPTSACVPRTRGDDGNAECQAFAADGDGRGYRLWCVNMALAIGGVEACVGDDAPSCPADPTAVRTIGDLEDNAIFVDDGACAASLDACLSDLFGASDGSYPPDGTDPPRRTSVGCSDDSANCTFDPTCKAEGPSCENSLSCDGACADSSGQGGCGGTCDSCTSGSGGGGGGGGSCISCEGGGEPGSGDDGCGSCDDSSSSGGGDGCGSCEGGGGSCEGGGDGGGGGDGCGSCEGGGGDGDGCGSCEGGGGDSCGSCDGGGGSSNTCGVAKRPRPSRPLGLLVQVMWALLPIPAAALVRRRARKHRGPATPSAPATEEVTP